MKIIILGTAYPLRGGLAAYNERLARAFQEAGHTVTIYTFSLQYPDFLFPGTTQYSDEPAPKDLNIKVRVNSVNPLNWWSVGRELDKLQPDLIVCKFWLPFMGPCLGTILRLAKRNGKTKVVSVIDNIIPHEKRPGDYWFAKYFAGAVDGFVAMSRSVEEDLKKFVKKQPTKYIPHPIYDNYGPMVAQQEARAKLGIGKEEKVAMFFGFIRKYKGLDLLLEAMALPSIRNAGIKLLVAGEYYTDKSDYEEQIKRLGIEENLLLFTEFIPDSEVRWYFGAADILVQPYRTATQSGISQMCYHFGKPMLVTNVGGLPEIVPHGRCGYVVEPVPQQIADAMLDFFETAEKQRDMESNVLQERKKYAWETMVDGILTLRL